MSQKEIKNNILNSMTMKIQIPKPMRQLSNVEGNLQHCKLTLEERKSLRSTILTPH